jgi:hypothetical protein
MKRTSLRDCWKRLRSASGRLSGAVHRAFALAEPTSLSTRGKGLGALLMLEDRWLPSALGPVNTVPGPQATNVNTSLVFTGSNGISVSDSNPANTLQETLTVTNGTLTLAQTAGLTFSTGTGTADATMTFQGSLGNINAALNGLTYTPNTNYTGSADVQISSTDAGGQLVGNTTIFGTSSGIGAVQNQQIATQINVPFNGTVTSVTAYLQNSKGNNPAHFGLYADASGQPGALLAEASANGSAGTGWYTLSFPSTNVSVGSYWLALAPNKSDAFFYKTTGGATRFSNFNPTAGFSDPWTQTTSSNADSLSIFATLTPTTAFSATDQVVLSVGANHAPVLNGANDLAAVNENDFTNNGTLISDLLAGQVTDADAGAFQGIAVTGVNNANGTWQYTLDGGTTWTAFGSPSIFSAQLLAADATTRVRFVPTAEWTGTVANGITFLAWDQTSGTNGGTADTFLSGGGSSTFSSASASASVVVAPVNDPPVRTFGSANNLTVLENSGTTSLGLGSLTYSAGDADDSGQTLTYTVSAVPSAAFGNIVLADGSTLVSAGTSYTLTQLRGMQFQPAGEASGGPVTFSWSVQDDGGTANGGADTLNEALSITITPVNDPPVRSAGSVNNLTVPENAGATSLGLGGLGYAPGDADDAGQTLTYTVTAVPTATLGNIVLADGTTIVSAGTAYTLAQLQGMQFRVTAEATGGPATFSWRVQDNGGTANGGVNTLNEALSLTIIPVNDPPTRTAGSVTNLNVLENAAATSLGLAGLAYGPGDADDAGQTLTFTVSAVPAAAFGNIVLADGVTVVGVGSYTLAQLQGMQFQAAPEASGGPIVFAWQVQDNGGTANGGKDTLNEALSIAITPVNDPPLRTAGNVNNLTVPENAAPLSLGLGGLAYAPGDADDAGQTLTYTITAVPAAALGNVVLADGVTVVSAGTSYTLTQLQGMKFHATVEASSGTATFSWSVQDNGGTANGGLNTLNEALTITLFAVNDAPVRTAGSVKPLFVLEDASATSLGLGSLAYGPGDADDAGQSLTYTVTAVPAASLGNIVLADGVTVVSAGSAYTLAQLQGMQFVPIPDATGGPLPFTWQVHDNGGTANGGNDTLTESLSIYIIPVIDPPTRTAGSVNNLTVLENSGTTSLGLGGLAYDPGDDDDPGLTAHYTVTSVPPPALGNVVLADGITVVTAGSGYTLAQLQGMQFQAAPEASGGPALFSWSVQNLSPDGDASTLNESLTITITAVNDPPLRTAGNVNNLTVLENAGTTSLGLSGLAYAPGDADDAAQTLTYTVTAVPAAALGNIVLADGVTIVSAGGSYSLGQLQGMQFSATSEASGGPATFSWSVQDNGGTANGGRDTLNETLTISVTAVNDPPLRSAGNVNNLTVKEDSKATSLGLAGLAYGPGDTDDAGQTLTYTITTVPPPSLGKIVLADGVTVVSAGSSYSLAQLQGMEFLARDDATGGPLPFTWQVRDNGGTANGGSDTLTESLTITVTAVNDPPSRTAGSVNNLTVLENSGTTSLGLGGLAYDPGDADDVGLVPHYTVTVVPPAALGNIVLADGTTVVTAGSGYTLAQLQGMQFQAAPEATGGPATFAWIVQNLSPDGDAGTLNEALTITITPVNDPPLRTAGSVNSLTVLENAGPTSLGLGSLAYVPGDADDAGQKLTYTITAVPPVAQGAIVLADGTTVVSAGGSYSLAQLQGMQFRAAAEASGSAGLFSWNVQDNGGTANGGSDTLSEALALAITAVNDPPQRTAGSVNNLTVLENAGTTSLGLGGLAYSPGDADDAGQTLSYTVTAVPSATLGNIVLADGTTVVSAGTSYSLAQLQGMQFAAATEASGGPTTFAWQVRDNGGIANGGVDTLGESLVIAITAVNDPPVRSAGSVNNLTVLENAGPTSLGLGSLAYVPGDADDAGQTLTYTITAVPPAAQGTIVLADGTTFVSAGTSYSLAQLQGMQFLAAAEASGGAGVFSWSVQDNGGIANGGSDTLSEALALAITAVNDPPQRTAGSVNNLTVLENAGATSLGLSGLAYAPGDADDAAQTLTYTVTAVPSATLGNIVLADGTTIVSAGGSYTLAQLQGMQFAAASEASGGPAIFAWQVQDNGGIANGGVDTLGESLVIAITAVNDPPLRTAGSVNNLTVLENAGPTSLGLGSLAYVPGDADDAGQTLTYTITAVPPAAQGTIVLADGITVVSAGSSYTLTQLQGMQFLAAAEASGGAGVFSWSVRDNGGTANGGSDTLGEALTLAITAVNDPPQRTAGSVNNLTVLENAGTTSLGLGGLAYSPGDADDAGQTLSYTVTAVPSATLGNIVLADGTTIVSAGTSYSLAQLQGMQFAAAPEASGGPALFAWQVRDNGGTANGGIDTISEALTISITAVNDPPVRIAGSVNNLTVLENAGPTSLVLGSLAYVPGDADDAGQTLTYTITAVPPAAQGAIVLADGTTVVSASGSYTLAQLQGMQFLAAPEASGSAGVFSWSVQDNGGTANGGVDTLSESLALAITAVNDPPVRIAGSVNNLAVLEDAGTTSLGLGGLAYSPGDADDAGQSLTYTVTAVPSSSLGNIVLADGTTIVNVGSSYSLAQLQGMQFQAATEASGGPATFAWQVQDNGGTANGGADTLDEGLAIAITAVNDPPMRIAGNVNNLTVLENAGPTSLGLGSLAYVPGDADDAGQTLTYTITAVPPAAQGAIVLADGTTVVSAGSSYTLAQLQGMQFLAAPEASGSAGVFSWNVQDNGGTANGGVDTLSEALTISITAVNDPPVIAAPGDQATGKNTPLVFSGAAGNPLSISDGDADGGAERVVLTASNGTLSLSATAGLTFLTGTGSADAQTSFTGSLRDINAALDGLTFDPAPDYGGAARVTILADDQGNTGVGGPKSDYREIAVAIGTPGITASPTQGLVTTEAGGQATFTVVLATQPTADVTIGVTSSDPRAGVPSVSSVTFTPANWNAPQTITVTGVDDFIADDDRPYTIVLAPLASADPNYSGLSGTSVSLLNQNTDSAGVRVTPLASMEVGAAGFGVALTSQPLTDVIVYLHLNSEGSLSTSSLRFTPADWHAPQIVTLTGVPATADGGEVKVLVGAISAASDPGYAGLTSFATLAVRTDKIVPPDSGLTDLFREGGMPLGAAPLPVVNPLGPFLLYPGSPLGGQVIRKAAEAVLSFEVGATTVAPSTSATLSYRPDSPVVALYSLDLRKPVPSHGSRVAESSYLLSLAELLDEKPRSDGSAGDESPLAVAASNRFMARSMGLLWNQLDRLGEPLDTDPWSPAEEATFAALVTVSAGYVALNIRSLYLLATVFLSKPLWRQFDVDALLESWEEGGKQALLGSDDDDENELYPILD